MDRVSDDSDEGDGGSDRLSFRNGFDLGVIVSALQRGAKRPCSLGCNFQASVNEDQGV
jgi:hypothetical protein